MGRNLFTWNPDEDEDAHVYEAGEDRNCTPELLLEFYRQCVATTGRPPTLGDCKRRFGGILSSMVHGWELKRRGLI